MSWWNFKLLLDEIMRSSTMMSCGKHENRIAVYVSPAYSVVKRNIIIHQIPLRCMSLKAFVVDFNDVTTIMIHAQYEVFP